MKSASSVNVGITFPPRFLSVLREFSSSSGKSISWHVRKACILYFSANNIDVSDLENPEGQGVRTDLKKPTRAETDAIIEHLKKTKKLKL